MSNDVENFDTGRKTVDVMFGPGASGQTPASGALLVSLPFATNTSIIIIIAWVFILYLMDTEFMILCFYIFIDLF